MLCGDLPLRRRLAGAGGDRGLLEGGAKYADMKEAIASRWGTGSGSPHAVGIKIGGDKFIRRGDEDSTRFKKGAPTRLILVKDTGSAGVARERKVPPAVEDVEERRLF